MCGIAGVLHLREGARAPERALLARMARALRHRGPDAFGYYRDARIGLVHARLSIVDIAAGQQPLCNEDASLWVVFNGEVFNHVELRAELEAHGHRFRTRSDTEVIVHAWEQWKEAAFERFNGQWALALWDAVRGCLVLSRDRVGVRPLHLCEFEGRFYFSSEVKGIFADERVPRALDPEAIDDAFTFWAVLPPRTPFAGVSELPAAHVLTLDLRSGTRNLMRYWSPRFPSAQSLRREHFSLGLDDAAMRLRERLAAAIKLRMTRADVPVGSFLSGGLDSSLIAALGRAFAPGAFKTFSLRFEDEEYDETPFQRAMVARLGSEHSEVVVSRTDISTVFPDVVCHAERPLLRTAPAPLYLLSRLVHGAGIKVVLTGEGADEVLGGYDLFREAKVRRFWARHPDSKLRPRLFEKLYPYLARSPANARGMALKFWARGLERASEPTFSHEPRWASASALKRLFSREVRALLAGRDATRAVSATLPPESSSWEPLALAQYLEITTLLTPYLLSAQGDRMLMAHSVEGRMPFLDVDVMEFANALPERFKLRALEEKLVLKLAAAGLVPDSILRRAKQPYRAPDALAFTAGPRIPDYVSESFSEESLRCAGVFDPAAGHALFQKCAARGRDQHAGAQFSNADNMAFVGVLSVQLLHSQLIERPVDATGDARWTVGVDRVGEP